MSPKSELMIYLGIASEEHGNLFMRLPGNIVFTSAHADFDEKSFPRCKDTKQQNQILPDPKQSPPSQSLSELDDDDDLPHYLPPKSPQHRRNYSDNGTVDDDQQAQPPVQIPSQLHLNRDEGQPRRNPTLSTREYLQRILAPRRSTKKLW